MKIYYAHHTWKYNTKIEEYELACIARQFPDAEIINPRTSIVQGRPEAEIIKDACGVVKSCDAVVFSTVSGMIGHGIFNELVVATNNQLPIYCLHGDACYEVEPYSIKKLIFDGDNRVYALMNTPDGYLAR